MDGPGLDPGILEHTLKPIAFTEQAAAVGDQDRRPISPSSEADYRDVVSAGRRYSGTDYIEASYRRGQARSAFLKLFERVDALVTPTVAVTAFEAGQIGVDQIDGTRGRSASRLVAVLLADQSRRPAGGDAALRLRSRRPADRPADRRALARRADDLPHRRRVRAGAALGGVLAAAGVRVRGARENPRARVIRLRMGLLSKCLRA